MPTKHEIWMEHFLSGIDEIIVIGWKGTEAKFQDLLKRRLHNKKVTITTVTGTDDSVRKEFNQSIPNAVYKETASTFSEFIQQSVSENKPIFDY